MWCPPVGNLETEPSPAIRAETQHGAEPNFGSILESEMSDNMQFPIPNAVLEPYIKAAVSTAIAAALGDGTALVGKAVTCALTTKVSSNGKVSNSSYDNVHDLATIVSTNAIQEIAREVIKEMAEEMRPQIKAAITSHLKKSGSAIAKTMVEGIIGALKTDWNVRVSVTPPTN